MAYFYGFLFIIIGLVLLISLTKENKIFILAGGFFIVLGAWWIINEFMPFNMFADMWGIVLKVLTGIVLVILIIYFVRSYLEGNRKHKDNDGGEK